MQITRLSPAAKLHQASQAEEKKYLVPFYTYGVIWNGGTCGVEHIADCPFCGKEKHFYVNSENGCYDCKVCGASGGIESFLAAIYDACKEATTANPKLLDKLYKRRNLPIRVLQKWGIVHNVADEFLVPIWIDGEIHDLGRYDLSKADAKIKPTATRGLRLGNLDALKDQTRLLEHVYICEGAWDAFMLDWLFEKTGTKGIVIWVPSAKTFPIDWANYFVDRTVIVCLDNDHAADIGNTKVAKALKPITKQLKFLNWSPELKTGYDVSDFIHDQVFVENKPDSWRICLSNLFRLLKDKPTKEIINEKDAPKDFGYVPTLPELLKEYSNAMETNEETNKLIKYILASVISVDIPGADFVWSFIVGPPSSGKTMLLTSVVSSPKAHFESSLHAAALISGLVKKGMPDPSIIPKLNNRCLVLKDYTELLGKNEQELKEVQSIMRGAYDGDASRTYGSGAIRRYTSRFAFLAGVTRQIFAHNDTEVGDRMLRYIIDPNTINMDAIQDSAIDSILNGGNEKFNTLKERVAAFLSKNWDFSGERVREIVPKWYTDQVKALANLTAAVRTKVVRHQAYERNRGEAIYLPETEFSTRLTRQLIKLGIALAVLEEKKIDDDISKFVIRIAQDTIYGYQFMILKKLLGSQKPLRAEDIAPQLKLQRDTVANYLDDMLLLDLVENKTAVGNRITFSPSKKIKELWSKTWLR